MVTGIVDTFEKLVEDFDNFVDAESTEDEAALEMSSRMHAIHDAMKQQLSEYTLVSDSTLDDEIEQDIIAMAKKYGDEYLLDYLLTRFLVAMLAIQNMFQVAGQQIDFTRIK